MKNVRKNTVIKYLKFLTIILLLVLLLPPSTPETAAQTSDTGEIVVDWKEISNTSTIEISRQRSRWEFGPTLEIGYQYPNGTPLTDNSINYDEWFKIVATIPKDIFDEDADLKLVNIILHLKEPNVTATVSLWLSVENGAEQWRARSIVIDRSKSDVSLEIGERVFDLNVTSCSFTNGSKNYVVEFVGRFGENAPNGAYSSWMYIMDTKDKKIVPSWSQYCLEDLFPELILGSPREYTFEILNEQGEETWTVLHNETIMFRINYPSGNISYAVWLLPTGEKKTVTVTLYNPFTRKTVTRDINVRIKLVFKYENGDIEVGIGCEYFTWNSSIKRYEHIVEYNATQDKFVLNNTLSGATDGQVTWAGYFTENMASGVRLIFQIKVLDEHGNAVRRDLKERLFYVLGINTPLSLHKIVDPTTGNVLRHVDKEEPFNLTIGLAADNNTMSSLISVNTTISTIILRKNFFSSLNIHIEYDVTADSYSAWYENRTLIPYEPPIYLDSKQNTSLPSAFEVENMSKKATSGILILNFQCRFTEEPADGVYWYKVDFYTSTGKMSFVKGAVLHQPSFFTVGETPNWWGRQWAVAPNGALDLDGDLSTTDDQYYVERIWSVDANITKTWKVLFAKILWNPDKDVTGDELLTLAWMGTVHHVWDVSWSETFIWYYAENKTVVNQETMQKINSTIWNTEKDKPKSGYWALAPLTRNITSEEYSGRRWWLNTSRFEWTWFHFATLQTYRTAVSENSVNWVTLKTSYAGLLLYDDFDENGAATFNVTNGIPMPYEVSHTFLINNVDNIVFKRPFNSVNSSGRETVPDNETVDFGVTLENVSGILYPTRVSRGLRSIWRYYLSSTGEIGVIPTDFDYAVSRATIDKLSLIVHFSVEETGEEELNNHASMKIDQYIGNWELLDFNTTAELEGKSLAIAYFTKLTNVTRSTFAAEKAAVDSDDATVGARFSYVVQNASVADMKFGGTTYVWGKDNKTYTAYSATEPFSAFKAMYESETGDSVSQWLVDRETYIVTTSFPKWDGYRVDNDPEIVVYTSKAIMEEGEVPPSTRRKLLFFAAITIVTLVAVVALIKKFKKTP